MILSILIPSIPERLLKVLELYRKLYAQMALIENCPQIEILCHTDNLIRTIGEKRTDLLKSAKGDYMGFVDDDDDIADDYLESILYGLSSYADVITFKQQASIDGKKFIVNFGLKNENEEAAIDEGGNYLNINRKPFQMCIWKRDLIKDCVFPSKNYFEDAEWVDCAVTKVLTEHHIDKVLHYYNFTTEGSRAT